MLGKVLDGVLRKTLSEYIEDFGKFNVSLFKGKVKLSNLILKESIIPPHVPLSLKSGSIGELSIDIPISKLTKNPTKIDVDRVDLHVVVKEKEDWDRASIMKQAMEDKLIALQEDVASNVGGGLVATIVNNLQIIIHHVTIRVEFDPSWALICKIFEAKVISTDEQWRPTFSTSQTIFKLAAISGLSITADRLGGVGNVLSPCDLDVRMRLGLGISSEKGTSRIKIAFEVPKLVFRVSQEDVVPITKVLILISTYLEWLEMVTADINRPGSSSETQEYFKYYSMLLEGKLNSSQLQKVASSNVVLDKITGELIEGVKALRGLERLESVLSLQSLLEIRRKAFISVHLNLMSSKSARGKVRQKEIDKTSRILHRVVGEENFEEISKALESDSRDAFVGAHLLTMSYENPGLLTMSIDLNLGKFALEFMERGDSTDSHERKLMRLDVLSISSSLLWKGGAGIDASLKLQDVKMVDLTARTKFPILLQRSDAASTSPLISVHLKAVTAGVGRLLLTDLQASNLLAKDGRLAGGKSDPFCIMYILPTAPGDHRRTEARSPATGSGSFTAGQGGSMSSPSYHAQGAMVPRQTKETSVMPNTLNPKWTGEAFEFNYVPGDATFVIEVWDKDRDSNDFLGVVAVPIQKMLSGKGTSKSSGGLEVSFALNEQLGGRTEGETQHIEGSLSGKLVWEADTLHRNSEVLRKTLSGTESDCSGGPKPRTYEVDASVRVEEVDFLMSIPFVGAFVKFFMVAFDFDKINDIVQARSVQREQHLERMETESRIEESFGVAEASSLNSSTVAWLREVIEAVQSCGIRAELKIVAPTVIFPYDPDVSDTHLLVLQIGGVNGSVDSLDHGSDGGDDDIYELRSDEMLCFGIGPYSKWHQTCPWTVVDRDTGVISKIRMSEAQESVSKRDLFMIGSPADIRMRVGGQPRAKDGKPEDQLSVDLDFQSIRFGLSREMSALLLGIYLETYTTIDEISREIDALFPPEELSRNHSSEPPEKSLNSPGLASEDSDLSPLTERSDPRAMSITVSAATCWATIGKGLRREMDREAPPKSGADGGGEESIAELSLHGARLSERLFQDGSTETLLTIANIALTDVRKPHLSVLHREVISREFQSDLQFSCLYRSEADIDQAYVCLENITLVVIPDFVEALERFSLRTCWESRERLHMSGLWDASDIEACASMGRLSTNPTLAYRRRTAPVALRRRKGKRDGSTSVSRRTGIGMGLPNTTAECFLANTHPQAKRLDVFVTVANVHSCVVLDPLVAEAKSVAVRMTASVSYQSIPHQEEKVLINIEDGDVLSCSVAEGRDGCIWIIEDGGVALLDHFQAKMHYTFTREDRPPSSKSFLQLATRDSSGRSVGSNGGSGGGGNTTVGDLPEAAALLASELQSAPIADEGYLREISVTVGPVDSMLCVPDVIFASSALTALQGIATWENHFDEDQVAPVVEAQQTFVSKPKIDPLFGGLRTGDKRPGSPSKRPGSTSPKPKRSVAFADELKGEINNDEIEATTDEEVTRTKSRAVFIRNNVYVRGDGIQVTVLNHLLESQEPTVAMRFGDMQMSATFAQFHPSLVEVFDNMIYLDDYTTFRSSMIFGAQHLNSVSCAWEPLIEACRIDAVSRNVPDHALSPRVRQHLSRKSEGKGGTEVSDAFGTPSVVVSISKPLLINISANFVYLITDILSELSDSLRKAKESSACRLASTQETTKRSSIVYSPREMNGGLSRKRSSLFTLPYFKDIEEPDPTHRGALLHHDSSPAQVARGGMSQHILYNLTGGTLVYWTESSYSAGNIVGHGKKVALTFSERRRLSLGSSSQRVFALCLKDGPWQKIRDIPAEHLGSHCYSLHPSRDHPSASDSTLVVDVERHSNAFLLRVRSQVRVVNRTNSVIAVSLEFPSVANNTRLSRADSDRTVGSSSQGGDDGDQAYPPAVVAVDSLGETSQISGVGSSGSGSGSAGNTSQLAATRGILSNSGGTAGPGVSRRSSKRLSFNLTNRTEKLRRTSDASLEHSEVTLEASSRDLIHHLPLPREEAATAAERGRSPHRQGVFLSDVFHRIERAFAQTSPTTASPSHTQQTQSQPATYEATLLRSGDCAYLPVLIPRDAKLIIRAGDGSKSDEVTEEDENVDHTHTGSVGWYSALDELPDSISSLTNTTWNIPFDVFQRSLRVSVEKHLLENDFEAVGATGCIAHFSLFVSDALRISNVSTHTLQVRLTEDIATSSKDKSLSGLRPSSVPAPSPGQGGGCLNDWTVIEKEESLEREDEYGTLYLEPGEVASLHHPDVAVGRTSLYLRLFDTPATDAAESEGTRDRSFSGDDALTGWLHKYISTDLVHASKSSRNSAGSRNSTPSVVDTSRVRSAERQLSHSPQPLPFGEGITLFGLVEDSDDGATEIVVYTKCVCVNWTDFEVQLRDTVTKCTNPKLVAGLAATSGIDTTRAVRERLAVPFDLSSGILSLRVAQDCSSLPPDAPVGQNVPRKDEGGGSGGGGGWGSGGGGSGSGGSGVQPLSEWSTSISLDHIGAAGQLKLSTLERTRRDGDDGVAHYLFGVSVSPMLGMYHRTRCLTILPRFVIINNCDVDVYISKALPSEEAAHGVVNRWQRSHISPTAQSSPRSHISPTAQSSPRSLWAQSSSPSLPRTGGGGGGGANANRYSGDHWGGITRLRPHSRVSWLHEVLFMGIEQSDEWSHGISLTKTGWTVSRFCHAEDSALEVFVSTHVYQQGPSLYVSIEVSKRAPYRVENKCQSTAVWIRQKGFHGIRSELVVPPSTRIDYCWEDPSKEHSLELVASDDPSVWSGDLTGVPSAFSLLDGKGLGGGSDKKQKFARSKASVAGASHSATQSPFSSVHAVHLDKLHKSRPLRLPSGGSALASVFVDTGGVRVLCLEDRNRTVDDKPEHHTLALEVVLSMDRLSLSLNATDPSFEITMVTFDEILCRTCMFENAAIETEFLVEHFQIDNMLPKAYFPVVFHPIRRDGKDTPPFIQCKFMLSATSASSSGIVIVPYFEILLQPWEFKLESSVLMGMVSALDPLMSFLLSSDPTRRSTSIDAEDDFRQILCLMGQHEDWRRESTHQVASKPLFIAVDRLHIHSLTGTFSFTATPTMTLSRNCSKAGLSGLVWTIGKAVGSVSEAPLIFNELSVKHLFLTWEEVTESVKLYYADQGLRQVYRLVGSADVLGNPINVVEGLGVGVLEFFRKPAKGLLSGPSDFGAGLKNGTKDLLQGVVGGTFKSVARLTGTFSKVVKGVGSLQVQEVHKSNHVVDGLVSGGRSILIGLASGISGLVMKPVEGAKEGGAAGFGKGFVKGVVGVAAAPFAGLLDAASSVTEGIGNTPKWLDKSRKAAERIRPPRPFRSDQVMRAFDPDSVARLHVTVIEGKHVKGDSYVELQIDRVVFTTKKVRNSSPVWNQSTTFLVLHPSAKLSIRVMDKEMLSRSQEFGFSELSIRHWVQRHKEKEVKLWIPLQSRFGVDSDMEVNPTDATPSKLPRVLLKMTFRDTSSNLFPTDNVVVREDLSFHGETEDGSRLPIVGNAKSMKGWVLKRSKHLRVWNRRYMYVANGVLKYGAKEFVHSDKKAPIRGQYPVNAIHSAHRISEGVVNKPHAFVVSTAEESFVVSCYESVEVDLWLEALHAPQ